MTNWKDSLESITRPVVPDIEDNLGKPIPVLDDGFVRVIDYMGDWQSVAKAARISYGSGTKKVSDDEHLIRYLMRHKHTSPMELCEIVLHLRLPIYVARQLIRHRTASLNEYSQRYSIAIDSCERTDPHSWRIQSTTNKQGSSTILPYEIGKELTNREEYLITLANQVYRERLAANVAREQARKDLPLSNYTEMIWNMDLHNLLHFLSLRMDAHAQEEIRAYAFVIAGIVKRWVPPIWKAFNDYTLSGVKLSGPESWIVAAINAGEIERAKKIAVEQGWIREDGKLKLSRERQEAEAKFEDLGISFPWKKKGG